MPSVVRIHHLPPRNRYYLGSICFLFLFKKVLSGFELQKWERTQCESTVRSDRERVQWTLSTFLQASESESDKIHHLPPRNRYCLGSICFLFLFKKVLSGFELQKWERTLCESTVRSDRERVQWSFSTFLQTSESESDKIHHLPPRNRYYLGSICFLFLYIKFRVDSNTLKQLDGIHRIKYNEFIYL